jgi:hypothetical protein
MRHIFDATTDVSGMEAVLCADRLDAQVSNSDGTARLLLALSQERGC